MANEGRTERDVVLEELGIGTRTTLPDAEAPTLDRVKLRALAKRELSGPVANRLHQLIATYPRWADAYEEILLQLQAQGIGNPDERILAIVSGADEEDDDNSAGVSSEALVKEMRRFAGHRGVVTKLSFSRSGERAVSAGYDRTVRLWDLESGQQIRVFEGHEDRVLGVAISHDELCTVRQFRQNSSSVGRIDRPRVGPYLSGLNNHWPRDRSRSRLGESLEKFPSASLTD